MNEDYCFLNLKGERIFAGHHRPAQQASRAIVMCHPLGEEKLWSHRVFVSCARDLAAAGFAVLRIDFRGEGDSDRLFEESDLETRIEDTCLALDSILHLNPFVSDVTLLGLRLGGSVAAATAMRHNAVTRLLLWEPIVDGSTYMQAVLRNNLMFQMAQHHKVLENRDALVARLNQGGTVNVEGYELAGSLFRQMTEFRLADVLQRFVGETRIVQIAQDEMPLRPELAALADLNGRCKFVTAKEEPFWREIRTFYQRADELTRISIEALNVKS